MITVNCGFYRLVRGRRCLNREHKNLQGVQLDLPWEGDHKAIRDALRSQLPKAEGWQLTGYCLIGGPGVQQQPVRLSGNEEMA